MWFCFCYTTFDCYWMLRYKTNSLTFYDIFDAWNIISEKTNIFLIKFTTLDTEAICREN